MSNSRNLKPLIVIVVIILIIASVGSIGFFLSLKGRWNTNSDSYDFNKREENLNYFSSCEDLSTQLRKSRDSYSGGLLGNKGIERSPLAVDDKASSSNPSYYTPTNVQVEGIDEGDIVKTDGEYLYVAKGTSYQSHQIVILKIYPFNEVKKVSEIDLSDRPSVEMYLFNENLVVISNQYSYQIQKDLDSNAKSLIAPAYNFTQLLVYDVKDPTNPKEIRKVDIEGNFRTSRLKDGIFYLISNKYISNYKLPVPLLRDNQVGSEFKDSSKCESVGMLDKDYSAPSITTVAAIDLNQKNSQLKVKNYVGDAATVYMGEKGLYIVGSRYVYPESTFSIFGIRPISDPTSETKAYSTISKFSYQKDDVKFIASARFEGNLLNQFSLDEFNDNLRIVGTKDNFSNRDTANFLQIYDTNLNKLSEINNLAKGERIYSSRFYGDLGVMVTFKQVDPLFVFDLSDPKDPKLKGELKIPGFSNYLHFMDKNTIIGLGQDTANNQFGGTSTTGIKLALFDIADINNPREISKLTLGSAGSTSEALTNHKAFVFDRKHNLIVFPAYLRRDYNAVELQGAQVIKIENNKLVSQGQITHQALRSTYYNSDQVKRALVIEDRIITISDIEVRLNEVEGLRKVGEVGI